MRVPIPLIGPSYANRELPLSSQITKGLFPQIDPEARNIVSLHTFPGLKPFATLSGKGRGQHVMNEIEYAVYGNNLYSIDPQGVTSDKGFISGEFICDFADNGDQMMIVTGGPAYMFTASTDTLTEITDSDLKNPTTVGYLNSHFIFDNNSQSSENGEFVTTQVTRILTPGDLVDPLDFAKADAHPDDILKIVIYNELVYFFGSQGVDPWWNSGRGSPPFDKVQGGFRAYGLAGKNAVGLSDEFIYFLDNERIPRRIFGLQVTPIGNPALGAEWADYPRVDDAIGLAFTIDHQNFFQINFPAANRSWLYHEQSDSWTQVSYGTDSSRHRANSHSFVYGKNLVADHSNGQLYEMDPKTYTDNNNLIQRQRSTATIHGGLYQAPGREIFFDQVEFIVQTGEGIPTGQGSDPQLMIRFSDDGGRTFSAEEWYPLGVGGDYHKRVILENQGRAYQRIYELTYSEPTAFSLIDANADISVGI